MAGRRRLLEKGDEWEPKAKRPRQPAPVGTAAPKQLDAAGLLQLQRMIGNRSVYRLATGGVLQTKLQVGPAGDRYEREAEQVANEVMRDLATTTITADEDTARISRSIDEGVVGLEGGAVPADTEAAIQGRRGQGSPLPEPLRRSMESSFDADFSAVRVHSDSSADALNRTMQSRAFTLGSDIFFARGEYQPQSRSGQRILAHELTHTVQQGLPLRRSSSRFHGEAPSNPCVRRVFTPEFFMSSIVRHHFPNGGEGYQTSQTAEKMRREVDDNGAGGQDTGYGYKTKPLYHKSSGKAESTSVSAIFTVYPTYVVAMGEHKTNTSYQLYWRTPGVTLWNTGNSIALNNGDRIDVASKAAIRTTLNEEGYTTSFTRVGGQLSWDDGTAQGNQFTVDKTVFCGTDNVTLYALTGQGLKGIWERTRDSKDTTLANSFRTA